MHRGGSSSRQPPRTDVARTRCFWTPLTTVGFQFSMACRVRSGKDITWSSMGARSPRRQSFRIIYVCSCIGETATRILMERHGEMPSGMLLRSWPEGVGLQIMGLKAIASIKGRRQVSLLGHMPHALGMYRLLNRASARAPDTHHMRGSYSLTNSPVTWSSGSAQSMKFGSTKVNSRATSSRLLLLLLLLLLLTWPGRGIR